MTAAALPAQDAATPLSSVAYGLACVLVLVLQFGPAIGLLGYRLTGAIEWTLIGALRDATALALVAVAAASLPTTGLGVVRAPARWALVMVVAFALSAWWTSHNPFIVALSLRRLVLVPLLFVALLVIPWTRAQLEGLFKLLVTTSMVVAGVGIVGYLVPDAVWIDLIRIEDYTAASGFDPFGRQGFYESGRYFSHDLVRWIDQPLRRMLSTYLEPTTLAAGMAAALLLVMARCARGHSAPWTAGLFVVCGVLTLSKGFVLFLVVLGAWRLLGFPSPRHVLAAAALAVLVGLWALAAGYTDGAFAHLDGIGSGLSQVLNGHLLGAGVGGAGNYAASSGAGAESGLGNTLGQVGILALLPLLWIQSIGRAVDEEAARRGEPGGPWIAAWALFWTLTFVFSESSQGVGGNAIGFMACALYLHRAAGADAT